MPPQTSLVARLKVHLKLSISRLRIVQQRDQAVAKQQRRAMAQLLEQGKIESARIRVESIIRADLLTELHEILELYCELLLARIGLLESPTSTSSSSPHSSSNTTAPLDPGLEEAVRSIIYAAPRTEIRELGMARQLLVDKFGREFATSAMENKGAVRIPERVERKLRVEPPSQELVELYLREIAAAYDVPYGEPDGGDGPMEVDEGEGEQDADEDGDDDEPGSGGQAVKADDAATPTPKKNKPVLEEPLSTQELSSMTPPRTLDPGLTSPIRIAPPSPNTEKPNPRLKLPGTNGTVGTTAGSTRKMSLGTGTKPGAKTGAASGASSGKKPEGDIPDVDDLEKRFALLKK